MIVGLFPELLAPGGVQRVGRHVAAALNTQTQGTSTACQFLSLNDPAGPHHSCVGDCTFEFQGFARAKTRFLLAALRLAVQAPRLIVASHPNLAPVAWAMSLLSRSTRVVVLTHGIEVWAPLPTLRRLALRQADLVFAPSRDTLQRVVVQQGVAPAKLRRVAWGLDPEFPGVGLGAPNHLPAGFPSGRSVLTVARLAADERYKGVETLLEVLPALLATIPDLHLVIVGDGDDRPRLEQQAKKLNLAGRAIFLGSLDRQSLIACYRGCDVFAMPSRGEGFGLVFLEAMAMGKPVIGGAHGGSFDLIEDGVTGFLVAQEDAERLAAVLTRLLLDEQLRQGMGEKARERVLRDYSFDQFRARFLAGVSEPCES
jgi:phosphatidylinositol alpha-1,6-mannosyltransferase